MRTVKNDAEVAQPSPPPAPQPPVKHESSISSTEEETKQKKHGSLITKLQTERRAKSVSTSPKVSPFRKRPEEMASVKLEETEEGESQESEEVKATFKSFIIF